jgi:hypothetical protein
VLFLQHALRYANIMLNIVHCGMFDEHEKDDVLCHFHVTSLSWLPEKNNKFIRVISGFFRG